eukprot:1139060-Pelagomonas_calceolata.AAC.2
MPKPTLYAKAEPPICRAKGVRFLTTSLPPATHAVNRRDVSLELAVRVVFSGTQACKPAY